MRCFGLAEVVSGTTRFCSYGYALDETRMCSFALLVLIVIPYERLVGFHVYVWSLTLQVKHYSADLVC